MHDSTYSPLSPRVFFSFFLSQILLSFSLTTPQRGATAHPFSFKSALKYLLNSFLSNFSSKIYHPFFIIQSFKYLLNYFLNKKFNKKPDPNAREKCQNNTPTTSTSILSRFVRLGSFLFFSASGMLSLFLSSIFPSFQHLSYLSISSKLDSGAPSQHEAVSTEAKKQRRKRQGVSGMHTPFGSALGFIPDKMLDQYQIHAYTRPQMLDPRCQTNTRLLHMLVQSQSYHTAKFDSSMPASVRLRRHYLPLSPRSSLLRLHHRIFHQQLSSHLSRLFRSSFLISLVPTFTLSLSLQLPQLRRHSFPSLPLSLLRSSLFISLVPTSTLPLSFQLPRLRRHYLPLLPYSYLTSPPPFHTGIRSLDVGRRSNQSPGVLSLEAAICPSCTKDLATGETMTVTKAGLTCGRLVLGDE